MINVEVDGLRLAAFAQEEEEEVIAWCRRGEFG
jgi:hypothetical protein